MDNKRGEMLEDYNAQLNIGAYKKGQLITVARIKDVPEFYAVYRYGGIDLIPSRLIRVR